MTNRREFITQTAAASIVAAAPVRISHTSESETGHQGSRTTFNSARTSHAAIKSVIRSEETIIRYGGNGDCFHMSWANDDRQYVSVCDGGGFGPFKSQYNSRLFSVEGGPRGATFHDVPGYPLLGPPVQRWGSGTRYYSLGTLALDGYLYQYLSTFNRSLESVNLGALESRDKPDASGQLRFNGAKLIYSADNGRTWRNQNGSSPVVWEDWNRRSRETLVFFEEDQNSFAMLAVLQMGRNYEHNRDGYVYIYAPNGDAEGTMNELVMFRVLKGQLLNRGAYEYFSGLQSSGSAAWSRDIEARKPTHTFPRGWVSKFPHPYAWLPSVTYNAPLGLYMMASWGTATGSDGMWFGKPSYLGFWVSRNPWGPWTQVHEETAWMPGGDQNARAFQPQIAPKWIGADGKSFWLVWSDLQTLDEEGAKKAAQQLAQKGSRDTWSMADVEQRNLNMRQYQPYYAFNIQRVDLITG